jgi:hypothetical protein
LDLQRADEGCGRPDFASACSIRVAVTIM